MKNIIFTFLIFLAQSRKIGTADPIKEITNIFLTMLGVMLFVIGVVIYLKQKGYLQRMRRLFAHLFAKYLRRQEYNPMDESMKHVTHTLPNKEQPSHSPSMSHEQILPASVPQKTTTVKSQMKRINSYYHEIE